MRSDSGAGLWGPVLLVAGGIAALSHMASPPRPPGAPDWLLHGTEFALLGGALTRALSGGLRRPSARAALWALLGTLGWAALDELHQSFVPGRSAAAGDWVADAAGAVAGVAAVAALGASRRAPGPLAVVLVSGPGCPLCDEARQALARVARHVPLTLEERSIADDEALRRRFGQEIPVILVGGTTVARGRIDASRLQASLRWRLTESA